MNIKSTIRRLWWRGVFRNVSRTMYMIQYLAYVEVGETTKEDRKILLSALESEEQELKDDIQRHLKDEVRHGTLLRQYLTTQGWKDREIPEALKESVFVKNTFQLSPVKHFILAAYMAEKTAFYNLCDMRKEVQDEGLRNLLDTILKDESYHVAYLERALGVLARKEYDLPFNNIIKTYEHDIGILNRKAFCLLTVELARISSRTPWNIAPRILQFVFRYFIK